MTTHRWNCSTFKRFGLTALILLAPQVDLIHIQASTLHAAENQTNGHSTDGHSTDNVITITDSNNRFGAKLYSQLSGNGNTLFSPYSIHSALSMTYAGARGQTEKEMADVLQITIPQEEFHPAAATLKTTLAPCPTSCCTPLQCNLQIANKIYIQEDFNVLPDFVGTISNNYGAAWESIKFGENTKAADQINSWVSQETANKINDLVSPSDLNSLTRLVLVNALYFNAKWEKPFKASATTPSLFYKDNETTNVADMMLQTETFSYMENDAIQMIELPYADSQFSMCIVLPKEISGLNPPVAGLADVEKILSQKNIDSWVNQLKKEEVTVKLPKFKIESSYNLNEPLMTMGMPSAFGDADFCGIDGTKKLFISKVIHKAFIEVAEKGTEAAASTAVIMQLKCLAPVFKSPFAKTFNADHPFIFLIRDKNTNLTLFMGKVAEITGE